jgi:hypothetical protein
MLQFILQGVVAAVTVVVVVQVVARQQLVILELMVVLDLTVLLEHLVILEQGQLRLIIRQLEHQMLGQVHLLLLVGRGKPAAIQHPQHTTVLHQI